jgi:hypothetical protein
VCVKKSGPFFIEEFNLFKFNSFGQIFKCFEEMRFNLVKIRKREIEKGETRVKKKLKRL